MECSVSGLTFNLMEDHTELQMRFASLGRQQEIIYKDMMRDMWNTWNPTKPLELLTRPFWAQTDKDCSNGLSICDEIKKFKQLAFELTSVLTLHRRSGDRVLHTARTKIHSPSFMPWPERRSQDMKWVAGQCPRLVLNLRALRTWSAG